MVRSRSVKGPGSARDGGSPEGDWSARRRRGRRGGPWRRGSGGARAASGTLCCDCCAGSRSTRCRVSSGVELYRLEAWKERALAGLELGLKGSRLGNRRSRRWTRPSVTLGSCRWRWNCYGSAPVPRRPGTLGVEFHPGPDGGWIRTRPSKRLSRVDAPDRRALPPHLLADGTERARSLLSSMKVPAIGARHAECEPRGATR